MKKRWNDQAEGGGWFAIWLIRSVALRAGPRIARPFLYPITLYFYLRRPTLRSASRHFLGRVLGRAPRRREVLRHIHCFSATILDRVWLLATGEKGFRIEIEGLEELDAEVNRGKGVLLLGSHFGSFEVLRALADRQTAPLRVVLDKQQTPALTRLLEQLAPEVAALAIDASEGSTAIVLALAEAAERGEMIALLADRGHARERHVWVPFLGNPAPFPAGPWLLAAELGVPVVLCFGARLGDGHYRIRFELLQENVDIPRRNRDHALAAVVGRYADRLAIQTQEHPFNWFNFYDFWREQDAKPAAVGAVAEHDVGREP